MIQSAIRRIMRDGRTTYLQAWKIVEDDPEMKPLFDAMQKPEPPAPREESSVDPGEFRAFIAKQMADGLDYDTAFNAARHHVKFSGAFKPEIARMARAYPIDTSLKLMLKSIG